MSFIITVLKYIYRFSQNISCVEMCYQSPDLNVPQEETEALELPLVPTLIQQPAFRVSSDFLYIQCCSRLKSQNE